MRLIHAMPVLAFALSLTACGPNHGTSIKGLEIPIENAAVKLSQDVAKSRFNLIKTEELKKMMDEGKEMTIISALPVAEDKQYGILPGAVNGAMPKTEMELTQSDKDNLYQVAGSDKDRTIVIYCGFVACRRSTIAAALLVEQGYTNVIKYPGGIVAWEEMGYPVVKK
jgi:thiosulfate/3-mercaptopyruvate sulfurtransferase